MRASLKLIFAGIVALSLVSLGGIVAFWLEQSPNLEFKERTHPPGFRELVVAGSRPLFDPISVPSPVADQGERPKRSTRELCDALFRDQDSPSFGRLDNSIQVAVFFDYRCPHCRTLLSTLSGIQGDHLRIVYKDWPVLGAASELAARAALAADKQGYYLPFHQRLMSSRSVPNMALVEAIALELRMNVIRLRQDMGAAQIASTIQRHRDLASDLHLLGTPGFVVDRTIVQGAVASKQLASLVRNSLANPISLCQTLPAYR